MIWPTATSILIGAALLPLAPQAEESPIEMHLRLKTQEGIEKAARYLVSTQRPDGGWEAFGQSNPAITALVVKCLVQDAAYGREHPTVKRGLDFVLRYVQPDGGIYVPDEGMPNYHTSVALMALAATKDPAHAKTIENARQFLKKLQWDDGEGYETSSPWYGGQGYGKSKRPDLSNTQLMLEALHDSGLSADDPAYQKALIFVSRCQMLGQTNDQPFARDANDGGFVYSPVNDGESKAGTEVTEDKPRLRSYGSMTYAGFKSLLYAKVDRNDPRVRGAVDWMRRNFTLDNNPNMPQAQSKEGLYYYYHVFARAWYAWGEEVIKDAQGRPHRWRAELCQKLLSLQHEDGHWVNEQDRWYEGSADLVTAYAVLALQTALAQ